MYSPLSTAWDSAIRSGNRRKTVIDVYPLLGIDVISYADIDVSEFSIRADRRSANRRSGSVTIVDEQLLGFIKDLDQSFHPYSSEVRVRSGVQHLDGTEELVPLGVFRIEDIAWSEDETSFTMDLVDRSKLLQRAGFLFPYSAAGQGAKFTLISLVHEVMPWVTVNISIDLSDITLPGGSTYESDYLSAIHDIASALGGEFYFDVNGVAQVVPVPYIDPTAPFNQAVWAIDTGETGVLVTTNRSITRVDTYNEIVVLGAGNEDTQSFYVARDEDPHSVTYYQGSFGRSTLRVERQELTTNEQCQVVAEATLNNSRGLSQGLSLGSIGNPALQEGDIVGVIYQDGSRDLHLVDQISFDQTGASYIDTRVQRQNTS